MIVYGWKAKLLLKEHLKEKCPNCQHQNSVRLEIYQKYIHIMFLPILPIEKIVVSECESCKQVLTGKEMQDPLKDAYLRLRSQTRIPLWMFSGLAIVLLGISLIFLNDKKNDERSALYIADPNPGDIYEVRLGFQQYTLYKVEHVEGDSVFLFISQYETNKLTGLSDLRRKGDDGYFSDPVAVAKSELLLLFKSDDIIDIDRP